MVLLCTHKIYVLIQNKHVSCHSQLLSSAGLSDDVLYLEPFLQVLWAQIELRSIRLISKSYHRHSKLILKYMYNIGLKTLLQQSISELVFYGFACFDSLHPSQLFFSHIRMGLPGLNQY